MQQITSADEDEDVEKLQALWIIAKNVKCSSLCGKQYDSSTKY